SEVIDCISFTAVVCSSTDESISLTNVSLGVSGTSSFAPHPLINRSFIVNMEYVNGFDHTLISLYHDQFKAYLTRRKYSSFKKAYMLYLESTRK
ncbi:MAG: hypothetical protein K2I96_06065, partial [Lachnospiraceae bacterium]|nr:hypothetical protein [Lachnospiraceae bacterium]